MSYLNTLIRASQSPATDYHLCIFNFPLQRNEIYQFFTSSNISNMVSRIEALEGRLSMFEQKHNLQSEAVYQLDIGGMLEDRKFIMDFGEWTDTYQSWQTCRAQYKIEFTRFQQQVPNLKTSPSKIESKSNQITDEDSDKNELEDKIQSTKKSGSSFLMSIAGMFDSKIKDTSENVETIVSDLILKKHGKAQNGSSN